jgi:hypothetical protein
MGEGYGPEEEDQSQKKNSSTDDTNAHIQEKDEIPRDF